VEGLWVYRRKKGEKGRSILQVYVSKLLRPLKRYTPAKLFRKKKLLNLGGRRKKPKLMLGGVRKNLLEKTTKRRGGYVKREGRKHIFFFVSPKRRY